MGSYTPELLSFGAIMGWVYYGKCHFISHATVETNLEVQDCEKIKLAGNRL